ncbi:metal binding domain of Ada-domain-containing protein [Ampelomyces quisqualis]|uniref:Metal binding domain of Ada-domain-containing protein n=1 Tax=Ampelomyces quisqualis TaxID=50730 RepID=A0A6A5QDQ1_AMPQU|nr:metal binding domain of Ada-domain-containing protein [Ampelomyces quisqualis]
MAYNTEAARWRALTIRDAHANDHFVYSVRSTNIYCRPTCPARLARRANVGFYETPLQAEADGFRACKRCKPNAVLEDPQARAVEKACVLIDEALKRDDSDALRLQDLAKNVGLTPRYFHKIFKEKTSMTPREWAKLRTAPESISTKAPPLTASPTNSAGNDLSIDDTFDLNNFSEFVDFDIDGSATLGYNLAMGATEPVSMGYGNAIDMNILHELWNSGFEPDGVDAACLLGGENFMNVDDVSATPGLWPGANKHMPFASALELDIDALLRCDTVLF